MYFYSVYLATVTLLSVHSCSSVICSAGVILAAAFDYHSILLFMHTTDVFIVSSIHDQQFMIMSTADIDPTPIHSLVFSCRFSDLSPSHICTLMFSSVILDTSDWYSCLQFWIRFSLLLLLSPVWLISVNFIYTDLSQCPLILYMCIDLHAYVYSCLLFGLSAPLVISVCRSSLHHIYILAFVHYYYYFPVVFLHTQFHHNIYYHGYIICVMMYCIYYFVYYHCCYRGYSWLFSSILLFHTSDYMCSLLPLMVSRLLAFQLVPLFPIGFFIISLLLFVLFLITPTSCTRILFVICYSIIIGSVCHSDMHIRFDYSFMIPYHMYYCHDVISCCSQLHYIYYVILY